MQSTPQEHDPIRKSAEHHDSLLPTLEKGLNDNERSRLSSKSAERSLPDNRQQKGRSSIPWTKEFLSWFGGLGCFVGIVVVLHELKDKPVPRWQYHITPAAVIQLLATFEQTLLIMPVSSAIGQMKWLRALDKTAMDSFRVIDEASRGPSGSASLLANRIGGPTVSLGAIVTIVALGIGFFSQQPLKYNDIYHVTNDVKMPVAQYMNGTGFGQDGPHSETSGVDEELLTAPFLAIYNPPNTSFAATAQCYTGNCTWEAYQTLGVCNTCKNISSQITMKKTRVVPFNMTNDAYDTDYYTLPNGFGLTGSQPTQYYGPHSYDTGYAMVNISTSIATGEPRWDSVAFNGNGSRLLNVFVVGAAPGAAPAQLDLSPSYDRTIEGFAPPVAFECLLQLCVRTMNATYNTGVLTETELSAWTDQAQPSHQSGDNGDITLRPPGSQKWFVAAGTALEGTSMWLEYYLTGNATSIPLSNTRLSSPDFSSDVMRRIFTVMNNSETAVPDLMNDLANSLTLGMRTISYQPHVDNGNKTTTDIRAVVTWEWLILPAFELVASLVFLIVVAVETRRKGLVPWSNNVLAYFFHGLDEQRFGTHVRENQEFMEKEAQKLLMEFQPSNGGGHLVVHRSEALQ